MIVATGVVGNLLGVTIMSMLAAIALTSVAILVLALATFPHRRRGVATAARRGAGPIVLPVVRAVPHIDEFALYAACRDRVVLSLAADAPADVVAGAELVAGWYGFDLRVCTAGDASGTGPDDASAAAA